MYKGIFLITIISALTISSCTNSKEKKMTQYAKGTLGYDLNYLQEKDTNLIVLQTQDTQSIVLVSAKYQGKVFTSSAESLEGKSLGFVGYKALDSKTFDEHMNAYGGENRFWLGPEGGQYSVYFEKDKAQTYDNWHTPAPIDTESWDIVKKNTKQTRMRKEMLVNNYKGVGLQIGVERSVQILEKSEVLNLLQVKKITDVNVVAYETDNKITNLNDFEWTETTGTICIWLLDMFVPGKEAVSIIPFNKGDESILGTMATTDYFGEIPADRLKQQDGVLYLKTDGAYRSKLGMNAKRTKSIAGNYDPQAKRLTIVTFDSDPNAVYLNQEWNPKKNPLIGDALNAYNDGPLEDGSIMGPFLELESCSPAAFLKPGESLSHLHRVFHFVGEEQQLSAIAYELLGVNLETVKTVF